MLTAPLNLLYLEPGHIAFEFGHGLGIHELDGAVEPVAFTSLNVWASREAK